MTIVSICPNPTAWLLIPAQGKQGIPADHVPPGQPTLRHHPYGPYCPGERDDSGYLTPGV